MRAKAKKSQNSSERLEARISSEQKMFFQRAASLQGVTLTDFVVATLHDAAVKIVEEHNLLRLSLEDHRVFVDALMSPPDPNEALQRAATRYRGMTER